MRVVRVRHDVRANPTPADLAHRSKRGDRNEPLSFSSLIFSCAFSNIISSSTRSLTYSLPWTAFRAAAGVDGIHAGRGDDLVSVARFLSFGGAADFSSFCIDIDTIQPGKEEERGFPSASSLRAAD